MSNAAPAASRPGRPRLRPWRAALPLLALAGGGALLPGCRGVPVQVVAAARKNLDVRILADGNLEPPTGGELRAAEPGTVAEIAVREGQPVRRGELLLRLDNRELADRAREAAADLARLRGERAAAAAELAAAERAAAYQERIAAADRRLFDQAALPRATLEADELAARQATGRAAAAREQVAALDRDAGGGSRLALAQATAADLARRVAALALRAPADGVVYGLPRSTGEAVLPGQLLASVGDPAHAHLRFRVDPPDLPRLAVGQPLTVTFGGLPGRTWHGRVTRAGSGLREAGGREVGEALGELADPATGLPPNASVDVQVEVAEKPDALVVPRAALTRDGERRFVYLLADGRARRREVSTGLVGLSEIEVTRGLSPGDPVILDSPVPLAEGLRVQTGRP
jgi:HlyD family secretion protein